MEAETIRPIFNPSYLTFRGCFVVSKVVVVGYRPQH